MNIFNQIILIWYFKIEITLREEVGGSGLWTSKYKFNLMLFREKIL